MYFFNKSIDVQPIIYCQIINRESVEFIEEIISARKSTSYFFCVAALGPLHDVFRLEVENDEFPDVYIYHQPCHSNSIDGLFEASASTTFHFSRSFLKEVHEASKLPSKSTSVTSRVF